MKDQNNNASKIDSITFILYAYLNSLTHEDDEINFMIEIIQPFSLLGIQIYRLITQTPFEEWLIKGKLMYLMSYIAKCSSRSTLTSMKLRSNVLRSAKTSILRN